MDSDCHSIVIRNLERPPQVNPPTHSVSPLDQPKAILRPRLMMIDVMGGPRAATCPNMVKFDLVFFMLSTLGGYED